jgi:pilus assembly protein CpaE
VILLWDLDPAAKERYELALGPDAQQLTSPALVGRALHDNPDVNLVVIGPDIDLDLACDLAESSRLERPHVGVVLLRHRLDVTAMSQALRSGVREVVPSDDQTSIADAVRRSRELTARMVGQGSGGHGAQEGKVVTVFSAKGGVGKTTLSTNLATHLAHEGHKVVLIDLDLSFGDVAISLQLLPMSSVIDAVAMSGHLDEQGLKSLMTHHADSGLDVIAAPNDPSDADRIPANVVTELIRVARAHYEYVVVDTPPSFTEHVLAACDVSNLMVLIATLDIPAIKNLKVAMDTLDMLGNPKDSRVIVLNRADTKVGLREEDVVTAIKQPIAVSIPNSVAVPASINRGVSIVLSEPKHPVSVAIRDLGDHQVRERFGVHVNGVEPRRRIFGGRR